MAHQIALLLPHLGGKAYALRSAIVHAIGSLLHKAFDGCEQGAAGWRAQLCRVAPGKCIAGEAGPQAGRDMHG